MDGLLENRLLALMGRDDVISFSISIRQFRDALIEYRNGTLSHFMPNLYIRQYARIVAMLDGLNTALTNEVSAMAQQVGKEETKRLKRKAPVKKTTKRKSAKGVRKKNVHKNS